MILVYAMCPRWKNPTGADNDSDEVAGRQFGGFAGLIRGGDPHGRTTACQVVKDGAGVAGFRVEEGDGLIAGQRQPTAVGGPVEFTPTIQRQFAPSLRLQVIQVQFGGHGLR